MSDMQIAMRLTLADFASGPLAEFMAKLEGLQVLASKVTGSFSGTSEGAARVVAAAADAAVGTSRLKAAVDRLAIPIRTRKTCATSVLSRQDFAVTTSPIAENLAAVIVYKCGQGAHADAWRRVPQGSQNRPLALPRGAMRAAGRLLCDAQPVGMLGGVA